MTPTRHAVQRWGERFSGLDMSREYAAAKGVGKGTKRRLQKVVARPVMGRFRGYYYLQAPCGAIFVCTRGEIIVTVYPPIPVSA